MKWIKSRYDIIRFYVTYLDNPSGTHWMLDAPTTKLAIMHIDDIRKIMETIDRNEHDVTALEHLSIRGDGSNYWPEETADSSGTLPF